MAMFLTNQSHLIEKLVTKFQHLTIKDFNTPYDSSMMKLAENHDQAIAQPEYATAIGGIMYARHCTKSDIAVVVCKLSRYTSKHSIVHWIAMERVLRYPKTTKNFGL